MVALSLLFLWKVGFAEDAVGIEGRGRKEEGRGAFSRSASVVAVVEVAFSVSLSLTVRYVWEEAVRLVPQARLPFRSFNSSRSYTA